MFTYTVHHVHRTQYQMAVDCGYAKALELEPGTYGI
jgi:hypothetical protein